jgi:hypothetical protein
MCDEVQNAIAPPRAIQTTVYQCRVGLDYPETRTTKQKLQSIGITQKSPLIATVKFP